MRPNGLDDNPQLRIDIDREKASALGLSLADINTTLQATWGSSYVNDFIENGRVKRVYIQADAQYRMLPSDLERWYMRNANGEMVPFSTFSTSHWDYGSPRLERFNGVSSIEYPGTAGAGRQYRRGHGGDGGTGATVADRHQLRMAGPVVRGTAVRFAGAGAVRHLDPGRVPVPCGPV